MKTLLVDNNLALLQRCAARIRGRQPLAIATSKAQALELLRPGHSFDVVVACEKLADGSGLALLDEVQSRAPRLVRVFCAEPERLAVVRNRLSAFRLQFTLSYPIKPVKLELLLVNLARKVTAPTIRIRTLPG